MYKYLIIGIGLFGSAAARHLSAVSDGVALVGPEEPSDWAAHDGVFASHYDEARIVSQSAPDAIWQQLDRESIGAYAEIEAQSGIRFFTPSGRLTAIPQGDPVFYPYAADVWPNCRALTHQEMRDTFAFHLPSNYEGVFEDAPSGHLNPRKMVRAQTTVAQQQGAEVIRALVVRMRDCGASVEAVLQDGRVISAEKVLLTTGAFINSFDLAERKLAVKPESIMSVLGEVSAETAAKYADLPPLNYKNMGSALPHLSILPPLRFLDGRHYIKIVPSSEIDQNLPSHNALTSWFKQDDPYVYMRDIQQTMEQLLPQIDFLDWRTKPCVVCFTPTWKPMIDCLIDGRVYVAAGGNAGAAHPSDAIGKLSADFMHHNRWTSNLDHTPFRLNYADEWPDWMTKMTSVWDNKA